MGSAREGECLNLKSEWAGSILPGLKVTKPKGVSGKTSEVKAVREGGQGAEEGRIKEPAQREERGLTHDQTPDHGAWSCTSTQVHNEGGWIPQISSESPDQRGGQD